jgi:hypothetical protein
MNLRCSDCSAINKLSSGNYHNRTIEIKSVNQELLAAGLHRQKKFGVFL